MALSPAEVRQRVSSAVDGITGWSVSRWAGAGVDAETDDRMHKCAGVEVTDTELVTSQQRQKRSEGAWVYTTVVIHWRYRLRGDAHPADYDAAIGQELLIIAAAALVQSKPWDVPEPEPTDSEAEPEPAAS